MQGFLLVWFCFWSLISSRQDLPHVSDGPVVLQVCRCVQELPYSVADVELFEDVEILEGFSQPALTAVMQVGLLYLVMLWLNCSSTYLSRTAGYALCSSRATLMCIFSSYMGASWPN